MNQALTSLMSGQRCPDCRKSFCQCPPEVPEFYVEQGQIIVEDVSVVYNRRNLLVAEVDCHSKYPEIAAYGGNEVMLMAGEYTLKCDREALFTRIVLPARVVGWRVNAYAGRYTVTITAFPEPKRRPVSVWQRKEES